LRKTGHFSDVDTLLVSEYGPKIKELNLRAEALMHLVTLWDFGLIDSVGITKVMGIFDKAVVGNS